MDTYSLPRMWGSIPGPSLFLLLAWLGAPPQLRTGPRFRAEIALRAPNNACYPISEMGTGSGRQAQPGLSASMPSPLHAAGLKTN